MISIKKTSNATVILSSHLWTRKCSKYVFCIAYMCVHLHAHIFSQTIAFINTCRNFLALILYDNYSLFRSGSLTTPFFAIIRRIMLLNISTRLVSRRNISPGIVVFCLRNQFKVHVSFLAALHLRVPLLLIFIYSA